MSEVADQSTPRRHEADGGGLAASSLKFEILDVRLEEEPADDATLIIPQTSTIKPYACPGGFGYSVARHSVA